MLILDMSAGNRAIWANKNYEDCIYVDLREKVKPSVLANTVNLPFPDALFDLIVFDPPHVNGGKNGNISRDYGHHTTEEIRSLITFTAKEAYRVSKADALMAFKWNDHDQKFSTVLNLMQQWWEPLFGHRITMRTKHASSTAWIMLRRWD